MVLVFLGLVFRYMDQCSDRCNGCKLWIIIVLYVKFIRSNLLIVVIKENGF